MVVNIRDIRVGSAVSNSLSEEVIYIGQPTTEGDGIRVGITKSKKLEL